MDSHPLVLLVDDDEAIAGFVQMALEDEGYEVAVAVNGAKALAAVRQQHPQLILLDLRMPVMDGLGFARGYRQLPGPLAPIIVLTAGRGAEEEAAEIGAVAHLAKPFDVDDLIALVAKHLNGGG